MSNRSRRKPPPRRPPALAPAPAPRQAVPVAAPQIPDVTPALSPALSPANALMGLRSAQTQLLRAQRRVGAALVECHRAGVSDAEVGRVLDVSRQAVRVRRLSLVTSQPVDS